MKNEDIKELTIKFHNTYEKLAPIFGYETRKDTKELDFNSKNGKLMYATINEVVSPLLQQLEKKQNVIESVIKDLLDVSNVHMHFIGNEMICIKEMLGDVEE